jgi:helix-turn-helix protein
MSQCVQLLTVFFDVAFQVYVRNMTRSSGAVITDAMWEDGWRSVTKTVIPYKPYNPFLSSWTPQKPLHILFRTTGPQSTDRT